MAEKQSLPAAHFMSKLSKATARHLRSSGQRARRNGVESVRKHVPIGRHDDVDAREPSDRQVSVHMKVPTTSVCHTSCKSRDFADQLLNMNILASIPTPWFTSSSRTPILVPNWELEVD